MVVGVSGIASAGAIRPFVVVFVSVLLVGLPPPLFVLPWSRSWQAQGRTGGGDVAVAVLHIAVSSLGDVVVVVVVVAVAAHLSCGTH